MISFRNLLFRNLLYHRRGNFAVFLGIVLGSAVLTGALLVGDSLRGSLKALTLDQLGWVEEALVPGRFFRAPLANEISAEQRAPALLLQGSASRKASNDEVRVGKVNVFGIDAMFWPAQHIPADAAFWASNENEVVLNQTLANALGATIGGQITLHLQKADKVPREALMGERKEVMETLLVKVRQIVPDEGMARFSLKPTPQPVRNAFMPIRAVQQRLKTQGQVNAVFLAGAKPTLQADLHHQLQLDDWGLRYLSPKDRAEAFVRFLDPQNIDDGKIKKIRWSKVLSAKEGALAEKLGEKLLVEEKASKKVYRRAYVPAPLVEKAEKNGGLLMRGDMIAYYEMHRDYHVLESQRMSLDPAVVRALETIAPQEPSDPKDEKFLPRWRLTPILIYLADKLTDPGSLNKIEMPYAIVASFDHKDRDGKYVLADNQIMLMKWPGVLPTAKPGSTVQVDYFSPDEHNALKSKTARFVVHSLTAIDGVFDDPDLTPEFAGITDKLDMTQWENPPFPFNPKRVRPVDEAFWERYRTTPKAYVNLKTAQKLWASRFGDVTSMQVRPGQEYPNALPEALLAALKAEQGGFVVQKVREQALTASNGSSDFGMLFLGFSFFLIVSALLLVGLLVRLNIDRRAAEMGLLLATGWSHGQVRRLLLGEGALLSLLGALVGLGAAAPQRISCSSYSPPTGQRARTSTSCICTPSRSVSSSAI